MYNEQDLITFNVNVDLARKRIMGRVAQVADMYQPIIEEALQEAVREYNFDETARQSFKESFKEEIKKVLEKETRKFVSDAVSDVFWSKKPEIYQKVQEILLPLSL